MCALLRANVLKSICTSNFPSSLATFQHLSTRKILKTSLLRSDFWLIIVTRFWVCVSFASWFFFRFRLRHMTHSWIWCAFYIAVNISYNTLRLLTTQCFEIHSPVSVGICAPYLRIIFVGQNKFQFYNACDQQMTKICEKRSKQKVVHQTKVNFSEMFSRICE